MQVETRFFKLGVNWCYLALPQNIPTDIEATPVPCVIQFHGSRGYVRESATDWLDRPGRARFTKDLLSRGIAVCGSHAGGEHWGNPESVEANSALLQYLHGVSEIDCSRIGFWGSGFGSASAWKTFLENPNSGIRGMVLQQSLFSLASVLESDKFSSQAGLALGQSHAGQSDLEYLLDIRDPIRLTRRHLAQGSIDLLPEVMMIHGRDDKNFPCDEHAAAFLSVINQAGLKTIHHFLPGIGHDTFILGKVLSDLISRFFCRSL